MGGLENKGSRSAPEMKEKPDSKEEKEAEFHALSAHIARKGQEQNQAQLRVIQGGLQKEEIRIAGSAIAEEELEGRKRGAQHTALEIAQKRNAKKLRLFRQQKNFQIPNPTAKGPNAADVAHEGASGSFGGGGKGSLSSINVG